MAINSNVLGRDAIGVQARDTGDRLAGPTTSGLLQLSQSLANIEPTAQQALQNYASKEQASQAAQARKDALEQSGAKFADAVRAGKLEATQNPWYMEAYARESAAIRAQSAFGQLQTDSASWAERNDPKAFAAKWESSVADIAKDYTGKDELAGFFPVSSVYTQQALQSNVSTNVARIQQERTDNLSALGASALANAARANGGTITAAQAQAAIEPARIQWFATGGDKATWDKMRVGMVTSAAEGTSNADLLDLLRAFSSEDDGSLAVPGESTFGAGASLSSSPTDPAAATAQPEAPTTDGSSLDATVDALWGALAHQETGSRQVDRNGKTIFSPKGAGGIAQLMPSTAQTWATQMGNRQLADIAFDPTLQGAAANEAIGRYGLRQLLQQFNGDPAKALAAYNAGPNRRFLKTDATGDAFINSIPFAETKSYVKNILDRSGLTGVAPTAARPMQGPAPARGNPYTALQGGPSLYDQLGVAEAAETARYRIESNADSKAQDRLRAITSQYKLEGQQAFTDLTAAHGEAVLTGSVSQGAMIQELKAKGYSTQAIGEALSTVRSYVGDSVGLSNARTAMYGNSEAGSRHIFALHTQALTQGYSEDFERNVGKLVFNGDISPEDGSQLVGQAVSTTRSLAAQQRAEQAADGREGLIVTNYTQMKQRSAAIVGRTISAIQVAGRAIVGQKQTKGVQTQVQLAMDNWLSVHPGDWEGAVSAGNAKAAQIGMDAITNIQQQRLRPRRKRVTPGAAGAGANPRG